MRLVAVSAVPPLGPDSTSDLAPRLEEQRTLAELLAWLRSLSPPRSIDEIITQDEYTHDVLVHYDAPRWLAFDTN